MLHVINTIVPVFPVIAMGWFLGTRGFLSPQLVGPLNRIVYYFATEMNGSPDLATAAVSTNTLASCVTFILWLSLLV